MSTAALPVNVALISESERVAPELLAPVAAALQKQVQRDFAPIWKVSATVAAFPTLAATPEGYWPIVIKDDIGAPDALGYHTDEHNQPKSLVVAADGWATTCSHELLEMLADPFGNRLWQAQSPVEPEERVRILVEVCDPCEANQFNYEIDGVAVSDFATPAWYHTVDRLGATYSFAGHLVEPRKIETGGYVSWVDAEGDWFQQTWFGELHVNRLGRFWDFGHPGESLREAIDRVVRENHMAGVH